MKPLEPAVLLWLAGGDDLYPLHEQRSFRMKQAVAA